MVGNQSTVLVLGFNARPIVSSAKRLGLKVLVVDYWGDVDIYKYADEVLVVNEWGKGLDTTKSHTSLFLKLAQNLAEKHEIDFILVGSGFDDQFQFWEELNKVAPVIGNTSENIKKSRDKIRIYREAEKLGIHSPNSIIVKSVEDAVEAAELIGLPVVVRPTKGGGGQGIHLAKNIKEVEGIFHLLSSQGNVMIQEYIKGIDASCSLISDGTSALVVSINEQLIGLSELGAKDFTYCGNIVPLKATEQLYKKIKDASENLIESLNLKGSNGIDYVIRRGEPYLLEINPRFQGTLECVEMVTGLNIVEAHIEACQGILPKSIPQNKGYAVKNILFAKHDFIMPELTMSGIFDITKPGSVIRRGKPVCTIQIYASTRSGALFKAKRVAERIYSKFRKTRLNT